MSKIFKFFLIVSLGTMISQNLFSANLGINNSKGKPKISRSLRPAPRGSDELIEDISIKGIAEFVEENLSEQRVSGSFSEYTVPDSLKTLMEVVTPENNLNPSFDSLFLNVDLKNELEKYKESLELDLSKKAGASSVAKPLFLQGPPGAGKTFSIQSLAKGIRIHSDKKEKKASGLTFITISTSSVGPEDLDDIWVEISTNKLLGSMVILLDEVDAAGRDREKLLEANQFDAVKLVNALLMFVNKIKAFNEQQVAKIPPANRKLIFLMTAANYPVDKAFQDRFRSVVFRAPEEQIRKDLLFLNLGKAGINLSGADHPMIKRLALKTKGFSVRDIESVVANASEEASAGASIKIQPFLDAIALILKERQQKINNELTGKIEFYFFNDITSAESIQKTDLKSEFKYTLADKYSVVKDFANSFLSDIDNNKTQATAKTKRRALLFYGPPGTGKTYVARAIAKQAKSNLIIVNSGTLLTKFQGSGAESLLKILSFAKNNSPCILFFDEVDAIGDKKATEPERANMRQTLQMEMTNPNKPGEEIAFMAATNYPSNLEDAIKNRFTIQCPLFNPNYLGRIQLLSNNIKKTAPASADLHKIIAQLNSCTFFKEMRREDSKSFDDITIKFLTPVAARNLAPLGLSVGEKLSEAGEPIQYSKIPKLLSDLINKSPDTWILDEQKIKTREAELHAKALEDLDGSLGLSEYELFKENLREAGELGNMGDEKDLLIVVPSISEEVQKRRSKAFDEIADKYKDMPAYVFIRDLASGESTVDSKLDVFKKFASELIKQPELSKWLKPSGQQSNDLTNKSELARRSGINVCDDYNKARLSVLKKHSNLEKKLSAEQKKSKPKSDTKPQQKSKKLSQADKKEIMHKSVLEILNRRSKIK